jgi:hypothetical protein
MCAAVPGRRVRVEMDGEAVGIAFETDAARVETAPEGAHVRVQTSRRATVALADAETSLVQAVETGALEITGTPDDVIAFHEALRSYFQGAVRAPSFPALLRAFRRSIHEGGSRT